MRIFNKNNPLKISNKVNSMLFLLLFFFSSAKLSAQAHLTLQLDKPGATVSSKLYGLMTEEINHSYDGGLYAELIQNKIFKDNPRNPDHWSLVKDENSQASISLDNKQPINEALTVCLKLNIENPGKGVGIANEGYWGIPVKPQTTYHASFYAKASQSNNKPLMISIESNDGTTLFAHAEVSGVNEQWHRYHVTLTTSKDIKPATEARFVISTTGAGNYWFNLVSLFPPTYKNTVNGNRPDIMQLLADMKPAFLRFPGGNFLEGDYFSSRFQWKKTLGGLENRPGHPGCWNYRASDGMGLLEFLEWCEDLKMEPLLAVFAGYTLKGDHLDEPAFLKPFINEALEEIEYVTGDKNTKWGAVRASNGHPRPFKLSYIEIGNEDGFDKSGSYERRFTQFADAIRAKYPKLKIISTVGGKDGLGGRFPTPAHTPDAIDEHYYRTAWQMEEDAAHYDKYSRTNTKIFVGEWATREGSPTTNFNAALGDAAWMTGMERNSDVVVMSCYAPLFVNVNPGAMQWRSDLIGYNAISSYGSPSYYAQKMFNTYIGDKVIPVTGENIPTQIQKLTGKDSAANVQPKVIPAMFYVATRNSAKGTLYLKVVNTSGTVQNVKINLEGINSVSPAGSQIILKADKPEDTNSITEPEKIVPVISPVKGMGKSFSRSFPAYSITILQIETK